ncbi:hypothetical protein, partial [Boudabousia liubingyangii]|uniref:hypothetical protein n=1 Tax=Boudabousia liubingyangii TaxID=1921764 RepID=UPI001E626473
MALQTRQKRRRSRVRDTAAAGVVDTSRKTWPSLTDEGRTLTLEGPGSVAKIVKLEHAWRRLDGRNDDG